MLRTVVLCVLVSFSAPALALFKCQSGNDITYSDMPCAGGEAMKPGGPPAADTAKARQQAAMEKEQLRRFENARRRQEARAEKERQREAHKLAAKQKRCTVLARNKRWADEDVAAASSIKKIERAKMKARRVAEHYDEECGH